MWVGALWLTSDPEGPRLLRPEAYYENTLSNSFLHINCLPLPHLGLVGGTLWEVGFPWAPSDQEEEDMAGSYEKFRGSGRFNRVGERPTNSARKRMRGLGS